MKPPAVRHSRQALIDRAVREYEVLDGLLARLRLDDWHLPLRRRPDQDPWAVKDAVVHVTYWKADVGRFALGQRRPPGERGLGTHAHNRLVYERWKDRPPGDVLAYHRLVHDEVLAALRTAPESWLSGRDHRPDWPADLDGHLAAHRRLDIEKALAAAAGRR